MKQNPTPSAPKSLKLIKLAIQATRCAGTRNVNGVRKQGSQKPRPITLPKLKCLEEEPER